MRIAVLFKYIVISIVVFIAIMGRWIDWSFGQLNYEQLIFHLRLSFLLQGLESTFYYDFLKHCIFPFATILLTYFLLRKYFFLKNKRRMIYENIFFAVLVVSFSIAAQKFWHFDKLYTESQLTRVYGDFYEKHYVFPKQENIIFPQEKRNLIVIFAESMESTFLPNTTPQRNSSQEVFSPFDNLTPSLYQTLLNGVNFSDTSTIGGTQQAFGISWTIAGLVGYQCAIPLHLPISGNDFGKRVGGSFLKGATCLGNILDKEGYKQLFILPHEKSYAGTQYFMRDHHIPIHDFDFYLQSNQLPKDYQGFWGMKDSLTFEKAKQELLALKKDKPFALYLLTIDTHARAGYTDPQKCKNIYDTQTSNGQYKNAIACSDKVIGDFLEWVKKQDFYKNTTIVILGDHLSMNGEIFPENTHRRIYNAFINAKFFHPLQKDKIYNRRFSHFDILPTILDSLDVEVKGGKLGLGSDLLSNQPTLLELEGQCEGGGDMQQESRKKSRLRIS